jgi:hypothetical protein
MNRTPSLAKTVAAWCVTGCLVLVALGSAKAASAQVVSSFHDLQGSLNGGDRLAITERSGAVTKGRFVALSDQSLRVMAESARLADLPESSVARIDHLRSRKGKGALIGLIGGAVVGVLAVAVTPSCSGCIGPTKAEAAPVLAAFFGGIGAGIGAVVGAKRPHRRLIYLDRVDGPTFPKRNGEPPESSWEKTRSNTACSRQRRVCLMGAGAADAEALGDTKSSRTPSLR